MWGVLGACAALRSAHKIRRKNGKKIVKKLNGVFFCFLQKKNSRKDTNCKKCYLQLSMKIYTDIFIAYKVCFTC